MQDAVPLAGPSGEPESAASLRMILGGRLVERLPAAVYAACPGERGEWLYVSPRIHDILGYTAAEFVADPGLWASLLYPEDREQVLREEAASERGAPVEPNEYRMVRRDGQIVWVLDDAVLAEFGTHASVHHGLLYDITDRKRNEMLLAAHADVAERVARDEDLADIMVALAAAAERISGVVRCVIEVLNAAGQLVIGLGAEDTLYVTASGTRTRPIQTDSEPVHEMGFALPGGAPAGRVLLYGRTGTVSQAIDAGLAQWTARLATVVAVRAAEHGRMTDSLALLAATLDSTADGIVVLDVDNRIVGHNRKFLDMWQIDHQFGVTSSDVDLLHEAAERLKDPPQLFGAGAPLTSAGYVLDELELTDGRIFERYEHVQQGSHAQHSIGRVWSFRDVTAHRLMQQELRDQAFHDPLTPLANRALFVERLTNALEFNRTADTTLAVLLLDLDDFKTVNDGLGYDAGDRLLIAVAERLRGCLRIRDVAARLGGDEFVILLEHVLDGQEAGYAAERVLAAVSRPLTIDGQILTVRASIGIAVVEGGETAADLLRNADLAMYTAKREGGSSCRRYVPGMHAEAVARMELKTDLERAINAEQLAVHYQPVVELRTGRILGVEALVRWNHPVRGAIPPIDFIPLAEQTGLIERLGRWVLRQACTDTALWRRTIPGQEELTVSVNLSPRQLSNAQFPAEVRRVLWASGLPATALVLEITESSLAEPGVDAVQALNELKDIGLSLALDDFGTGYSSLAQLVRYPLNAVKVDKSFVDHIDGDPANSALTKAVLNIAKALSLSVTVEGIETAEQMRLLYNLGARQGQGYLMARPLTEPQIRHLLESGSILTVPPLTQSIA